ncbi:MAG: hypothetical protein ACRDRO_02175 [Pseudonocardiaceae bacterium]
MNSWGQAPVLIQLGPDGLPHRPDYTVDILRALHRFPAGVLHVGGMRAEGRDRARGTVDDGAEVMAIHNSRRSLTERLARTAARTRSSTRRWAR